MKFSLGRLQMGHDGCFEWEIAKLESRFCVRLPSPYRRFLSRFGRDNAASASLRGSDYYVPLLFDLRVWAEELLRDGGASFALHPQDFVIMMHQGYEFYYFRADGCSDDPPVHWYREGWTQPKESFNAISDWLRAHRVIVT